MLSEISLKDYTGEDKSIQEVIITFFLKLQDMNIPSKLQENDKCVKQNSLKGKEEEKTRMVNKMLKDGNSKKEL